MRRFGGATLSAKIIRLSDRQVASETDLAIDLRTAVDVAIRDLREIASCWGTDVARESADVVLLGNDLLRFVETLSVAHRTRRIIRANFVGTIVVDVVGIGLAAFGLLNPLFAAFIHVASELTFIVNAARLLPSRSSGDGPIRVTNSLADRAAVQARA